MRSDRCSVCARPDVDAIDDHLIAGSPQRVTARHYDVPVSTLHHHWHTCARHGFLPGSHPPLPLGDDTLVGRVEVLLDRLEALLSVAERTGDPRVAASVANQLRASLELLGRATGQLDDRPQVTVNLTASPEWLELRARLTAALQPYPDARAAVARALAGDAAPPPLEVTGG